MHCPVTTCGSSGIGEAGLPTDGVRDRIREMGRRKVEHGEEMGKEEINDATWNMLSLMLRFQLTAFRAAMRTDVVARSSRGLAWVGGWV